MKQRHEGHICSRYIYIEQQTGVSEEMLQGEASIKP